MELVGLTDPCPAANAHLYTQRDVYATEYFRWPALISCPSMLPPSSRTPAHQLNMGNWKKVLDFLATAKNINVLSTFFSC